MNIFLRDLITQNYLITPNEQTVDSVKTLGRTPIFSSRIQIDNYYEVEVPPSNDTTIRSHNLVTLRTRGGSFLSAKADSPGGTLVLNSMSGYVDTPRFGHEVFRIYKIRGSAGEPISNKDLVAFSLALQVDAGLETLWMSLGSPVGTTVFFIKARSPEEAGGFQFVEDKINFAGLGVPLTAEVPFLGDGEVIVPLLFAGGEDGIPPGGAGLGVNVSPSDFLDTSTLIPIVFDQSNSNIRFRLVEHLGHLSPCKVETLNMTVSEPVTEAEFQGTLTLKPGRNPFFRMRLLPRGGCILPGIVDFLPWRLPFYADLEAVAGGPLEPNETVSVSLTSDSPHVSNLSPQAGEVSVGRPLRFSFAVEPGASDKKICASITASFRFGDKGFSAPFAVVINSQGVTLDPD